MIKLAFFDVDGTLSDPHYPVNGVDTIGFPEKDWQKYCEEHKEKTYEYCKPVRPVSSYAEKLKKNGVILFVLSASGNDYECEAKRFFIKNNFPGLFTDCLFSASSSEKISIIYETAMKYGVEINECELIEDTYTTLLEAQEHGIKPTHVAAVVCDL